MLSKNDDQSDQATLSGATPFATTLWANLKSMAKLSEPVKVKVGVLSLVGPEGPEVMSVSGAMVSTAQ